MSTSKTATNPLIRYEDNEVYETCNSSDIPKLLNKYPSIINPDGTLKDEISFSKTMYYNSSDAIKNELSICYNCDTNYDINNVKCNITTCKNYQKAYLNDDGQISYKPEYDRIIPCSSSTRI
jgi:hypothetical protein